MSDETTHTATIEVGRPTLLTPVVQKQIEALILNGSFPSTAARVVGIAPRTYFRWRELGREAEERDDERPEVHHYREFYRVTEEAIALAEARAAKRVMAEDPKFWLTHGPARENWREQSKRVEVTGANGAPITHAVGVLDVRQLPLEKLYELNAVIASCEQHLEPERPSSSDPSGDSAKEVL